MSWYYSKKGPSSNFSFQITPIVKNVDTHVNNRQDYVSDLGAIFYSLFLWLLSPNSSVNTRP